MCSETLKVAVSVGPTSSCCCPLRYVTGNFFLVHHVTSQVIFFLYSEPPVENDKTNACYPKSWRIQYFSRQGSAERIDSQRLCRAEDREALRAFGWVWTMIVLAERFSGFDVTNGRNGNCDIYTSLMSTSWLRIQTKMIFQIRSHWWGSWAWFTELYDWRDVNLGSMKSPHQTEQTTDQAKKWCGSSTQLRTDTIAGDRYRNLALTSRVQCELTGSFRIFSMSSLLRTKSCLTIGISFWNRKSRSPKRPSFHRPASREPRLDAP